MLKQQVTFYGFQYPHHGQRSGYTALAREMRELCTVKSFGHPSRGCGVLHKLGLKGLSSKFPAFWFGLMERRVRKALSREGSLVHYFFPEDCLRSGGDWKGCGKLAVTLHQPLSHMKELEKDGLIPGFFEGLRSADLVILMSGAELESYRTYLPESRVESIPHGIDTSFFRPSENEKKEGSLRILTVGTWLRDYNLWAETAGLLKSHGLCAKHTVIANKAAIAEAKNTCPKGIDVEWRTGISDLELSKAYRESDLLFLPLKDAGANNALLEAMATGLPVVCSDLPATREYLGADGVFAVNSPEAFCNSIIELWSDESGRREIGANLRARACAEFSWAAIARQHMCLYEDILQV
ncbi:glycosyltransferase family 4 protein [Haloferula sp.]|uniref:glycosyltransferase family 4 protein n=1 Tax=Haloferula sp. TaxID=2497595 RepID=UPI00329F502C